MTAGCPARGFTLIEMAIALAVVALLAATAIPTVSGISRVRQRTAAQQLAGYIRHLYDQAVLTKKPIRLVIDLDGRRYHAESTEDDLLLSGGRTAVKEGAIDEEAEEEALERMQELNESLLREFEGSGQELQWLGWYAYKERIRRRKANFSAFTRRLCPDVMLPEGLAFEGVSTAALEGEVTKGKAYLHFFPQGFVEAALVRLVDEDGQAFSLSVEPLSGRVRVANERVGPMAFEEEEYEPG